MLTSADPLFLAVPGAFADPAGIAEQQGPGAVSLVVAHYADGDDCAALGDVYDAFVAVSGALVAVARSTRDYRFPVPPAAALDRFLQARDAGRAASVSLYGSSEPECARFLETVFYAECLKLRVDGAASAPLLADQLAQCGCAGGILELNDFSAPHAPRVRLVEVSDHAPDALPRLLDGFAGRALLYDRAKNRAAIPARSDGRPFDLAAAVDQAARLADARRSPLPHPADGSALPDPSPDTADRLAQRLASRPHPQSDTLSALLGELSGAPRPGAPRPDAPEPNPPEPDPTETPPTPPAPTPDTLSPEPMASPDTAAATPADTALPLPTPLAHALDALRVEVYALVEDAVGADRAQGHHVAVCDGLGLAGGVPPDRALDYLRALLCDAPPRRWHHFKRRRHDVRDAACRKLLAFHGQHAHTEHPAVHQATQLWSRLRA